MDLYEFIKKNIKNGYLLFGSGNFYKVEISELDKKDYDNFNIIKRIDSIHLTIDINQFEILPSTMSCDGKKFSDLTDFASDIIEHIKMIDINKLPLIIQAKIYELFYYVDKNNETANKLANVYYKILKQVDINVENWLILKDCTIRILQIIKEQNKILIKEKIKKELIKYIDSFFNMELIFQSIIFIEIYTEYIKDYSNSIYYLDKIISLSNVNIAKDYDVLKAYDDKLNVLLLIKSKKENIKQTEIVKAKRCVTIIKKLNKDFLKDMHRADNLYNIAIKILTKYKSEYLKELDTLNNEAILNRKKMIAMSPKYIREYSAKDVDQFIIENFNNLSFEEAVLGLTETISFFDDKSLKNYTINHYKNDIITAQSGLSIFDSHSGFITCKLKPLDINNIENSDDFEKYVNREYVDIINLIGSLFISRVLDYIKNNYKFNFDSFDFLIQNNAIVPIGKENIIKKGLYFYMSGDIDVALYILIPQVEEILRYIISSSGGSIIDAKTDDKDGSTIFIRLTQCLKNDVLNETIEEYIIKSLKCILDTKSGINLRNILLHGLMYDDIANSGGAMYTVALFIKWLSLCPLKCLEIKNSLLSKFPKTKLPMDIFKSKIVKENYM